jgi:LysM repeat protein
MACAGVIAAVPATHDLTSVKQAAATAHAAPAHLDAASSSAHSGYVSAGSTGGTVDASGTASASHTVSADSSRSQGTASYSVRGGDTLSSISKRYYSSSADWPWLAHENSSTVQNANEIYAGQHLKVPADPPANASSMSWYQPKHAAPVDTDPPKSSSSSSSTAATDTSSASGSASGSADGLAGSLSCSALEQLWEAAGGNPGDATLAASIATAESGGNQFATGTVGEEGYWQINPVNGDSTYDPLGNAHAAISLSDNGSNWSAWSTFTSGAYAGKC